MRKIIKKSITIALALVFSALLTGTSLLNENKKIALAEDALNIVVITDEDVSYEFGAWRTADTVMNQVAQDYGFVNYLGVTFAGSSTGMMIHTAYDIVSLGNSVILISDDFSYFDNVFLRAMENDCYVMLIYTAEADHYAVESLSVYGNISTYAINTELLGSQIAEATIERFDSQLNDVVIIGNQYKRVTDSMYSYCSGYGAQVLYTWSFASTHHDFQTRFENLLYTITDETTIIVSDTDDETYDAMADVIRNRGETVEDYNLMFLASDVGLLQYSNTFVVEAFTTLEEKLKDFIKGPIGIELPEPIVIDPVIMEAPPLEGIKYYPERMLNFNTWRR